MPFSSLIGNSGAKHTLMQMLEQKTLPNTLLFYGQEGVGKYTAATLLAHYLLGPKTSHPDLYILQPTGKAHVHPIESIRRLIQEAALPPFEASHKVFIIDEAEKMPASSSNALLKILEEPFSHTLFILITADKESMLPTLLSRCCKIPFFPISQKQIEEWLVTQQGVKESDVRKIAFLSRGSLGKAETLLKQKTPPWKEDLVSFLMLHPIQEYPQLVQIASRLEAYFPSDPTTPWELPDALFHDIAMWYRDLHLLKEGGGTEYLYHLDYLHQLKLALAYPLPTLEKILDGIARMRLGSARSMHLRHLLESFLCKNLYE